MEEKTVPKTPPAPFRRRIVLIKRAIQMKYVMLVFFTVLLTATILSVDFYYTVGRILLKELGEFNVALIAKNASWLLMLHISIYLVIVVLISIFISHKFAGPVFRLEKISESVAKGDLTVKVNFRQGDELFETAEYMNQMIISLRAKIEHEKGLSYEISEKLSTLSNQLQAGKITAKEASLVINELSGDIRQITLDFKL